LTGRQQRLQQGVVGVERAEHRAEAEQRDRGADQHVAGQPAQVALVADLLPDAVPVAQDPFDDE
jgi:hypothetical protein